MTSTKPGGWKLLSTLLAGLLIAGFGLASPVYAQDEGEGGVEGAADEAAPAEEAPVAEEGEKKEVEEIVVTGTMIRRKDLTTPAPVAIIGKPELQASGLISIGDILQNMPAQGNAINIQYNNGGTGSTRISLRSLGADRTLVLVNGRRFVPGGLGANASVDLNSIPTAAIERIEILKDGASAVYGSDAIGGVVNIITRRDFEGVEANAYFGTTQDGGMNYDLNVTAGWNTEKGNILVSAGYLEQKPIWSGQRDWGENAVDYDWQCALGPDHPEYNGPCDADGDGIDDVVYSYGSSGVPQGRITDRLGVPGNKAWQDLVEASGDAGIYFNDPDEGWRAFEGPGTSNVGQGDYYAFQPQNYLVTPQERYHVFMTGNYQFHKYVRGYVSASYVHRESKQLLAPMPIFTWHYGIGHISADNYYNPFGRDFSDFRRRMVESNHRLWHDNVNTFQIDLGLDGTLPEGLGFLSSFTWDLHWGYGVTTSDTKSTGQLIISRLTNALGPSIDRNTCGTAGNPIPGCVPMDFFGGAGSITQDMIDYVSYTGIDKGFSEMTTINFNLSGELFTIPFGDTVGLALGMEYREMRGGDIPDPVTASGDTTGNARTETGGGYHVNAYFAELNLPVLADLPGVDLLELNASTRFFTVGGIEEDISDFTWKFGARWQVFEDLAVRGTVSTAFRAPSVAELFQGNSDSYPSVTDPCDTQFHGDRSPQEQANCSADGIPNDFGDDRVQIVETVGGNPGLEPETAFIWTVGAVYEPGFLKGLSLTVDYWNIEIDNAIQNPGATVILNGCYGADTPEERNFCDLITRDPVSNDIRRLDDRQTNTGGNNTSGIDFALRYEHKTTKAGTFVGMFEGTWLHKYDRILADGTTLVGLNRFGYENLIGSQPDLKFNITFMWAMDALGAGINARYINTYQECQNEDCSAWDDDDPDTVPYFRDIDSNLTFDVWASYTFEYDAGSTRLSVGCNNLLDQDPPFIYTGFTPNDPSTHDFLGRYFYVRLAQTL